MYFDTSYVAKFYLNEPESSRIRSLARSSGGVCSSFLTFPEFHAALHRRLREGEFSRPEVRAAAARFSENIEDGLWRLVPVSESILRRTSALLLSAPRDLFLRTADAVHLTTAQEAGESEVWTNDRHMLAAADYFGLTGRSV